MPPAHPRIRWGILGTGNIARQFAAGLRACAGAELVAIGSRTLETAQKFGDAFQVPHRYDNYAALVQDKTVDVVYVATPHPLHHQNIILCLNAEKPVLCEKPLTINAREAREVINLATRKKLFLMEAMWTRFLPPIVKLREMLAERIVGEVQTVSADLGFLLPWDPLSRVFNLELAGGCLLDVGIYPISLATMVLGRPVSIDGTAVIGVTGVDEQNSISLGFEGGRHAYVFASIRAQTSQTASIMGSDGHIDLLAHWWRGGPIAVRRGHETRRLDLPIAANGYQYEADEVCQCLHTGQTQSKVMPLNESLLVLHIMDTLRSKWGLKYPME